MTHKSVSHKGSITQDFVKDALLYCPDCGQFFSRKRRGRVKSLTVAGWLDIGSGYWSIQIDRMKFYAHQLAWFYSYGHWPDEIDHKNGIRSDNRMANLRLAHSQGNSQNCGISKNNTSGVTGVIWLKSRNRWQARIMVNRKTIYLGLYKNIDDAAAARRSAEEKYFGEFAPSICRKSH